MSVRIAPSILSADWARLEASVAEVAEGGADWLHVDVMDGHFVPNITFGERMISTLKSISDLPLDVHLMVEEPERYIESFAGAGASVFTFHVEATVHVQRHLNAVREAGMKAGLALNPSTPVTAVEELLDDLDLLLIMSVNPGYSGQSFIQGATHKVARARAILDNAESNAFLEVDGGISRETIGHVFMAGADTFVSGSAIFGADSIPDEVRELRDLCSPEV